MNKILQTEFSIRLSNRATEIAVKNEWKVTVYYVDNGKGTRHVFCTFICIGGVLSGVSYETTAGNTLRLKFMDDVV